MKKIIFILFNRFGLGHERNLNITKHLFFSILYRGGGILINFLFVPLLINVLSPEKYGMFLTVNSLAFWFTFFDVGLGNGLRNKLTEELSRKDFVAARAYVSTAYFSMLVLSFTALVVFFIVGFQVDWVVVLNIPSCMGNELRELVHVVFSIFMFQLLLKLILSVYSADQHHSMSAKLNFYSQAVAVLSIWVLSSYVEISLRIFSLLYLGIPLIGLLILNVVAFRGKYNLISPRLSFYEKSYLKSIYSIGIKFFILSLSGVIIFSTDNVIISNILGPSFVVPYNIAFKYFGVPNLLMVMLVTPYWSSITEAYTKGDFDWIRKSVNGLFKISLVSVFLIFVMLIFAPWFYSIWVGSDILIPRSLDIQMAIYFSIVNLYLPFTYFLNGIGKIQVQTIVVSIMSLLNIPLSFFLCSFCNLNLSGVILATTICLLPHAILAPYQYFIIMKNKAKSVWIK